MSAHPTTPPAPRGCADYLDRVADAVAERIRARGVFSVEELADVAWALGCNPSDLLPPNETVLAAE